MAGKTVLILGGGAGGLVAANELRRQLGKEHRVVLVDKKKEHAFAPGFLWVMLGWREPAQITRELDLLTSVGIEVFHAEVLKIEPARRVVETTTGAITYDYLIVALGAEVTLETIPGLSQAAHTFYTLEGAERLRPLLADFSGGRLALVVAGLPMKCPTAPYEAMLLLDGVLRKRGLRDKAELSIFTPESLPMPTAGPAMGKALKQIVEGRGIAFYPQHKLASVDVEQRELVFAQGSRAAFDLLLAVPVHRSPQVVREAGLTGETGWIPVDPRTLRSRWEGVYAVGDGTGIRLPGRHHPDVPLSLPKAGAFAHLQAEVVAHNIAAEISGVGARREFDGQGYCFVELEHGLASFASGSFYIEPAPLVTMTPPSRRGYWGKMFYEKYWLWRWFRNKLEPIKATLDKALVMNTRLWRWF